MPIFMKLSSWFAVLLMSLLFVARPAVSRQYPDYGTHPFPGAVYPDQAAVYGIRYGDPIPDFQVAEPAYSQREAPERAFGGYRKDPCRASGPEAPYRGQPAGGGYWSASPPDEGAGRPREGIRQWGVPDARSHGYSDRVPVYGELPFAAVEGYRFRGDASPEFGGRGGTPGRYRYRFRPLTEQERRRMDTETGWRPQVPAPLEERPR